MAWRPPCRLALHASAVLRACVRRFPRPLHTGFNSPHHPSAYGAWDLLNIAVDCFATPKSISTGRLSRHRIRMFDGLMSRCRAPAACTRAKPSNAGVITVSKSDSVKGRPSSSRRASTSRRLAILEGHHQVSGAVRTEETPAGDDARMTVEIDQHLGLVPEPTQTVRKFPEIRSAPRLHSRALGHSQFHGQVFLDRDRQIQFVVPGPVDHSEASVTDHRLNREIAQDRTDWQGVPPLMLHAWHRVIGAPRFQKHPLAAGRRLRGLSNPSNSVASPRGGLGDTPARGFAGSAT